MSIEEFQSKVGLIAEVIKSSLQNKDGFYYED